MRKHLYALIPSLLTACSLQIPYEPPRTAPPVDAPARDPAARLDAVDRYCAEVQRANAELERAAEEAASSTRTGLVWCVAGGGGVIALSTAVAALARARESRTVEDTAVAVTAVAAGGIATCGALALVSGPTDIERRASETNRRIERERIRVTATVAAAKSARAEAQARFAADVQASALRAREGSMAEAERVLSAIEAARKPGEIAAKSVRARELLGRRHEGAVPTLGAEAAPQPRELEALVSELLRACEDGALVLRKREEVVP